MRRVSVHPGPVRRKADLSDRKVLPGVARNHALHILQIEPVQHVVYQVSLLGITTRPLRVQPQYCMAPGWGTRHLAVTPTTASPCSL